jgi:sulfhydrogenase subunit beta (sulfur reductase)
MKRVTEQSLQGLLESLAPEYRVHVPVRLPDGTRMLAPLGTAPLALAGGRLPRKPTDVFFPQTETVLRMDGAGDALASSSSARPLLVVGFTAQDLRCLEFLDRFFARDFRDSVYFAHRENAVVVGVSGRCGRDGSLMPISGKYCDLELIADGTGYLVAAYTEVGEGLANRMEGAHEAATITSLQGESAALGKEGQRLLERTSELIRGGSVPQSFWQEIADRCIACSACNLVCPTCSCFEVYDHERRQGVERNRLWDSCLLEGFQREASGHNPMGSEWSRTRRRMHHKLAADVERWGHMTCFLCGRCDDACPSHIGIKAVCRDIVNRFGP